MPLFKSDPAVLRILTTINEKLNQIMSTNNTLAIQLQQAAANLQRIETKIEGDLQTLSATQAKALADFKEWLTSNAAGAIDPVSISMLNDLTAKFQVVDDTLGQLAATAQAADPGTPPVTPVNG